MELNTTPHKKIISDAAGKIAAHQEFKAAYNKELAMDFDPFRFFKLGENKISQVLASFLDPKGPHGQGSLFLEEFTAILEQKLEGKKVALSHYKKAVNDIYSAKIRVEKPIDRILGERPGKRRIDIYIPIGGYGIAIENKIWAKDQPDQMKDYQRFLHEKHTDGYLLVYMTPYGHKPDGGSITEAQWTTGLTDGSLCAISYKNDILPMLESWEAKCKAERVRFFIREFKTHLHVKFLGGNKLNMKEALENIIRKDAETVKSLAYAYKAIEKDMRDKIDWVANKFISQKNEDITNIQPLNKFLSSEQYYVFKISLKTAIEPGTNQSEKPLDQVYIHLSEKNLRIRLKYYIQNGSSSNFSDKVSKAWIDDIDAAEDLIENKEMEGKVIVLLIRPETTSTVSKIFNLMERKVKLIKEAIY